MSNHTERLDGIALYSGWREFVMWVGVGVLLCFGVIVGRDYFNRVLTDITEGDHQ